MKYGGDLSNYDWPFTADTVAALKAAGWERAIVGCQWPPTAREQIELLREGGIEVSDLYAEPDWANCLNVGASELMIDTIWLVVEPGGIQSLDELRHAAQTVGGAGYDAGIYGNVYDLVSVIGIDNHEFAHLPLWLAAYHNDRSLVTDVDFCGWTRVAIHQYADSPDLAGRPRDYDAFFEEDEMTPEQAAQLQAVYECIVGRGNPKGADELAAWNANGNSLLEGYLKMQQQVATLSTGALPDHKHTIEWKDRTGGVVSA